MKIIIAAHFVLQILNKNYQIYIGAISDIDANSTLDNTFKDIFVCLTVLRYNETYFIVFYLIRETKRMF